MGFNRPTDESTQSQWHQPRGGGWVIGLILVAIGIIFLLQNAGITILTGNWWALFILIPAIGSGVAAWGMFQRAGGRFTPAMSGALTGFLMLTFLTVMFFFDLSWSLWWPVFIIIAGVSALLGRVGR